MQMPACSIRGPAACPPGLQPRLWKASKYGDGPKRRETTTTPTSEAICNTQPRAGPPSPPPFTVTHIREEEEARDDTVTPRRRGPPTRAGERTSDPPTNIASHTCTEGMHTHGHTHCVKSRPRASLAVALLRCCRTKLLLLTMTATQPQQCQRLRSAGRDYYKRARLARRAFTAASVY